MGGFAGESIKILHRTQDTTCSCCANLPVDEDEGEFVFPFWINDVWVWEDHDVMCCRQ